MMRFVVLLLAFLMLAPAGLPADEERDLLDSMTKVMKKGDFEAIEDLAQGLARVNTKKTIKALGNMIASADDDEDIQIAAIKGLAKCDKEQAFEMLVKAVRKVKSPVAREVLFDALVETADEEYLNEKGLKHSRGLIRGVAYYHMSKNPQKPDEELTEKIEKEKDPDAILGLAVFLGKCLQNQVAFNLAKDKLVEIIEGKDLMARGIALTALASTGGAKILKLVKDHYSHPDWRVRLEICERVGQIGDKDALLFLVDAMRKEDGRLRKDIASILKNKTGKDHGLSANDWRNEILGKVGGDGEEVKTSHAKYYGLDIVSKRIIFIFDKTGSMLSPSPDKLQRAKDKLCDVIQSLDADLKDKAKGEYERIDPTKLTHFSIIAFSHDTLWWKKKMVRATDQNVKLACSWIQGLQAEGPTHADLPLKEALEFALGGGKGDKPTYMEPESEVDTIFFVTDGSPYKFEFGQGPAAESRMAQYSQEILAMVEKMNKKLKIVINAAGILPPGTRSTFLESLVQLTNGEVVYVDGTK